MATDPRMTKLKMKGLAKDVAQGLVEAGLATPKLVKAAQDSAIEAAVGSENLTAVRAAFPAT